LATFTSSYKQYCKGDQYENKDDNDGYGSHNQVLKAKLKEIKFELFKLAAQTILIFSHMKNNWLINVIKFSSSDKKGEV